MNSLTSLAFGLGALQLGGWLAAVGQHVQQQLWSPRWGTEIASDGQGAPAGCMPSYGLPPGVYVGGRRGVRLQCVGEDVGSCTLSV